MTPSPLTRQQIADGLIAAKARGLGARAAKAELRIGTEKFKSVSEEFGISWKREKNQPRKRAAERWGKAPKYSPETYAMIEKLHADGLSFNQIAAQTKLSRNTIAGHVRRNSDKFARRGSPIIYAPPKPWKPPPLEHGMRTLPALPSLIGYVQLAPMAPWLEAA